MQARFLFIIRIALITGVTAFAALVLFQRSRGAPTLGAEGVAMLDTMRLVLWGLAGSAIAGVLFLRSRVASATPQQGSTMTVIGWALGEGVALFGVVQHYLGAPVTTLAVGVLTFVVALVLLPVPQERT